MIKSVKIKNKIIGLEHPTFLIAEMACAHQGDVNEACRMVEIAIKANVDAIQTQIFKNELELTPLHEDWELNAQLELSYKEWEKIIKIIKKSNSLFFSSVYDLESVKFLIDQDVDAFKIHSSDISNPEMLIAIAKSKKPIFLSTGASKIEELKKAINILRKNDTKDIILMHGYQGFPTKIEDSNLKFIKTFEKLFGLNIGFYDHVDGGSILSKIIPIMAIGYGAQVIEKHFIMSREEKGIDYQSSLDSQNFMEFVQILRESEKAIGTDKIRDFTEGELKYREYAKKCIVAIKDIPKGTKISRDLVEFLRNGIGISPDEFEKIEGKIANRDIKKYNNLSYDNF